MQRKKNELDSLFEKVDYYHPNITLTTEKSTTKFLVTEITRRECKIDAKVCDRSKMF